MNFSFGSLAHAAAGSSLLVSMALLTASPSVAQGVSPQTLVAAATENTEHANCIPQASVSSLMPGAPRRSVRHSLSNEALPWMIRSQVGQTCCIRDRLSAVITAAVTADPAIAPELVTYAIHRCPGDAPSVAAAAATADPTDAAAIVAAATRALPPGKDAAPILAAVTSAVPGSANQVTASVSPADPPPAPPPIAPQVATQTTANSPPPISTTIDGTSCNPSRLTAAIKTLVSTNPSSSIDIVTYATQHCPGDAAQIAAAAAGADPTDAAAILVAIIASLPPDQAETDLANIVVAVERAVPGSADQITTAISQVTFSQGPGLPGRGDKGAPLVAPWTDVPDTRILGSTPI